MIEYHALFLALVVGTEAFFTWLTVINIRYSERILSERADWVRDRIGVEHPAKMADYTRARTAMGSLSTWILIGFVLLILYSGLFADVVVALEATGLGPIGQGVVLFAGIRVGLLALSLTFGVYDTFVIEELFGFNRQTVGLWLRDAAVGLTISTAIVAVTGGALLWVVLTFPEWWWVGGIALYVAFVLALQVLYPRVYAPLFNDFTPIEEGELRTAVEEVFDRAGFECDDIYQVDASRRSSHSNAYFIGFGSTKRVVLYDTLIEHMDIDEVQSILAHELAHWKRGHVWKLTAGNILEIGVMLFAAWFLVGQEWLLSMFGVPAGSTGAAIVLALLWLYPIFRLIAPFTNRQSLRYEREADDFAAEVIAPEPMVGALERLSSENLLSPFSHPLYETFHHDHPPIQERIRRLEDQASSGGTTGDGSGEVSAGD